MVVTAAEYRITAEGKELKITHPDKPLWPEAGISKLQYLQYLITVAPYMLPFTKDRLLTVIRYPHGIQGHSFFQKNLPDYAPKWIPTCIWEDTRYPLLNDLPTLIWLANQAALEWHVSFHPYNSEEPTELVFDLDPSTPDFHVVAEVALKLKGLLDELQLPAYVKTSGASGLQIYVPIKAGYTFQQTRRVSEFIAKYMTKTYPQLVTIERMVKKRGEKLYIDYLQHWRGKTLPAPYSTRARPEATVSTPLTWEEVGQIHPTHFTIHTVPKRLRTHGDLFAPLLSQQQRASLDPILVFLHGRKEI